MKILLDIDSRLAPLWCFVQSKPMQICVYASIALHLARLALAEIPTTAPYQIPAIAAVLQKIVIIFIVAMPFQLLFPAVRRAPKISTNEFWLDIIYWFQGLLLSVASFWVVVAAVRDYLWSWTSGPWLPDVGNFPFWIQVALAIAAYDFLVYWRHRFEHTFRVLWAFHAVHHSTRQVDVLTTLRVHPFELVAGVICNTAVSFIGFDALALTVGFTLYLYWNYFIHTNVKIRFPGFLKYVLVSPFMHQWHHALDEQAMGKNVGVIFAWNDWLFGTIYYPSHWPTAFGINAPKSEYLPQNYLRQLFYPLQYAWAQIQSAREPGSPPKK